MNLQRDWTILTGETTMEATSFHFAQSAHLLVHSAALCSAECCSLSSPKTYESITNKSLEFFSRSAIPVRQCLDYRGMREKSRNWRHRSLPNLFEPSKEILTVSPTTSISCNQSPPGGASYVGTEITGLDMDQEIISEITLDEHETRRKTLVRKQFSGSDDDDSSESSSRTSSLHNTRSRSIHRPSVSKRLKTSGSSCCFLMDADNDDSISSAGELERFFDSMGLEDQNGSRLQSSSRSLQIQVSDDAMDSEEEEFESVSIAGLLVEKDGFTIGVIPSVETDDDEPEPESESRTPSGVKMDVEEAMRRLTSLPHPDIRHIASDPGLNVKNPGGPRPAAEATGSTTETPPPSGDGSPVITKNLSESVVLRNARIYKWLVNCRTAVQK